MKRYKVTMSLAISAKSKNEAKNILADIIESGSITTKDGRWLGLKITDRKDIPVEELPF